MGGELFQRGRPVAFYSKKLTPAESRYHVTDRELMGAIPWLYEVEALTLHGNSVQQCTLTMSH